MAKSEKGQSHFWPSYSDLMTNIFFLMLVLFVLTIVSLRNSLNEAERLRRISEEQLQSIRQIQEAVNQLPREYFEEDAANKRWVLKEDFTPQFRTASFNIYELNDTAQLNKVGRSLLKVIDTLNSMKKQEAYRNMNITYLVVIEGMASRDGYPLNDELSYNRALSLYKLWRKHGISFEDSQCEVQIAGSGVRGRGRYNATGEAPQDEWRNKRIIIQIVPKISKI